MAISEVRIGIVGVGPWGTNILRAFSAVPRARVTAIYDKDTEHLLRVARGSSCRFTEAFHSLVSASDVDAVVIATPPETHAELAAAALDAGRHVFVEKPMALSSLDAALLCSRAREASRKLMVGHVLLYHPLVSELLTRVRAGQLGEIVGVRARRFTSSRRKRSEGAWWALAPHDVSIMRQVLMSDATAVSAVRRTVPGAERAVAELSFANGCRGDIECGLAEQSDVRLVLVRGSRHTALFDERSSDRSLLFFKTLRAGTTDADPFCTNRVPVEVVSCDGAEPLTNECRRFVESILDDLPVASDGPEGLAVVSTLEAGAASLATGGETIRVRRSSLELEGITHRPRTFELPLFF